MSTWTCGSCNLTIEFPDRDANRESCPRCTALGPSYAIGSCDGDTLPHRWVSAEMARADIIAGRPLRQVYVESIDLDGETLPYPVEIVGSVIGLWTAREATFGSGLDLSGTEVLGPFETGAGESKRLGRFARGASFEGLIRLEQSRFHDGARFEGCHLSAGLAAAGVHVWGPFDLSGTRIGNGSTDLRDARLDRLTMRDTLFQSDLMLDRVTVRGEILVSGIVVEGFALAGEARFEGEFYLGGSRFSGEFNFSNARFCAPATFDASEFQCEFDLNRTHFESAVDFHGLDFCGWADVEWAHFHGPMAMEGIRADSGLSFEDSVFHHTFTLRNISAMDETHFRRASFQAFDLSCSEFRGRVDLRDVCIAGDMRLDGTRFHQGLFLVRSRFGGPVLWESVIVGDSLKVSQIVAQSRLTWCECTFDGDLILAGARFERVFELPGTRVIGCLDLQQAEFGELADVTGCRFECIRIADISAQTESFKVLLEQVRGHLHSERNRDYATAAREWDFLHHSFEDQNHTLDSDRAYYKMRQMDNRADRMGFKKICRVLELVFVEWGTGYGTRPVNIVLFSLCTVLALGLLYALVPHFVLIGGEAQDATITHLIMLSFSTFLAWEGASIILALEAFLGGFLVAVFAAILSRRMFRS